MAAQNDNGFYALNIQQMTIIFLGIFVTAKI
jgi:hypothetical protein